MAIKFLREYETKAHPPEVFTAGQLVKDRDEASERHFVLRRIAAFDDGKGNLTDIDGNPVEYVEAAEVKDAKSTKGKTGPGAVMSGGN